MDNKAKSQIKFLLSDIQKAMGNIVEFISDSDINSFLKDNLTKDAVAYNIHIIGIRAQKLPSTFKKKNTEVNWKILSDLKAKIMPEYYNIKYPEIWNFSANEIPINKPKIDQLVHAQSQ